MLRLHPEETEAAGRRVTTVDDVVRRLFDASPGVAGRPRVIAIDGRGGFRPAAWAAHDRPGSIAVPAGAEVVLVEGTDVVRAELAPWLDASVWMQGDLGEQERRLTARDGDSAEQREHVASWLREELPFLARERPWARATLIVGGPAPIGHDPDTELAVAGPAT